LTSRADGRVCPILPLSSSCKVRAGDAHGKSVLLESHCLGGQQTDAHHFARPREVELHPYLQQGRLLDLCDREGIKVTAFSPLGSSSYVQLSMDKGQAQGVLADEAVKRVASSVGKTPAQVVLRWAIQRNVIVIPKTSQERRLDEMRPCGDGNSVPRTWPPSTGWSGDAATMILASFAAQWASPFPYTTEPRCGRAGAPAWKRNTRGRHGP
jgi:hypothetical protein